MSQPKDKAMDDNMIRLYCHSCGEIVSNFVPKEEIKEWLTCPYCFDCIIKRIKK